MSTIKNLHEVAWPYLPVPTVLFRRRQMASEAVESLLLLGQQPVLVSCSASPSSSSTSSLSSNVSIPVPTYQLAWLSRIIGCFGPAVGRYFMKISPFFDTKFRQEKVRGDCSQSLE